MVFSVVKFVANCYKHRKPIQEFKSQIQKVSYAEITGHQDMDIDLPHFQVRLHKGSNVSKLLKRQQHGNDVM